MNRKVKTVLVTFAIILGICLLFILGARAFVKSIVNQRDCEWANIDNIELHAHIDIPDILESDCIYDEDDNSKRAYFKLNEKDLNIERYVSRNHLIKTDDPSDIDFSKFLNANKDSLLQGELYHRKKESSTGKNTYTLFDRNSLGLWVSIEYAD